MSQPIDAIYEDGVFKPLSPPDLPEKTPVKVIAAQVSEESDDEVATRQKTALEKLWAEIDADPEAAGPDDDWSVANNADDVLYGGPNGPA